MNTYKPGVDETGTRADTAAASWMLTRGVLAGLVLLALAAAGELVRVLVGGAP
jgi:hypothetical protein